MISFFGVSVEFYPNIINRNDFDSVMYPYMTFEEATKVVEQTLSPYIGDRDYEVYHKEDYSQAMVMVYNYEDPTAAQLLTFDVIPIEIDHFNME